MRVAGPEDVAVIARLLTEFRDHEERDWPPEETIRAGVERLIGRDDTDYLLGGDPPMGFAQLRYRYGVWWDAEDCNLEDLFVRAGARGSGLGRALLEAVIERARARGCRRIELDTGEDNAPARALYGSLGFSSGLEQPGQLGIYMSRVIPENLPPGA